MTERDCYCTPSYITIRLPEVDLDPCSNPRSTVKAKQSCMLERGQNGLLRSWRDLSVFINGPFSNLLPFASKLHEASMFMWLSNTDHSTKWWRIVTEWECYELKFYDRIQFMAPSGIKESQNDSPQSLIVSPDYYPLLKDEFRSYGRWWHRL